MFYHRQLGITFVVVCQFFAATRLCAQIDEADNSVRDAISNGKLDEVKTLLQRWPQLLKKQNVHDGTTILSLAAEKGQLDIVKFLIDSGANANEQGKKIHPFIGGYSRYFNGMQTPLLLSLSEAHGDVARYLVSQGARGNVSDQFGFTPLQFAARHGYVDLVKEFLKQGASIDQKKVNTNELSGGHLEWPGNALHLAAEGGHADIIQILLDHKAKVNARDTMGRTPLHRLLDDDDHATSMKIRVFSDMQQQQPALKHNVPGRWQEPNRLKALQLLLDANADINAQDHIKRTPMYVAQCYAKNTKLFKMLNARHPNYSAADAVRMKNSALLEKLIQNDAKLLSEVIPPHGSLFLLAVSEGDLVTVEILMRYHGDVESGKMKNVRLTPLWVAVEADRPEMVRLFIEKDKQTEFNGSNGIFLRTFYRCQASQCSIATLKELLRRRASIDDQQFLEALYLSPNRQPTARSRLEVMQVLLDNKGNLDLNTEKMIHLRNWAIQVRDDELTTLLTKHGVAQK